MSSLDVPAAWFAGKDLTTDWSSAHFATWALLLADRRAEALDVLEIGSWEGRSALFFLNHLPACRLTCVDTFAGGAEHVSQFAQELPHVEARFRANTAEFSARVRVLVSSSADALAQLASEDAGFDVVLVDGGHEAAEVLADAEASWQLLRSGGLLILDDYEWAGFDDPARTPKPGIDTFLSRHTGEYDEVERGWQIALRRR